MKLFQFEWAYLRAGMVVKISVTSNNITEAHKRIAAAYGMTLPMLRRFLQREGYELSVMEVRRK